MLDLQVPLTFLLRIIASMACSVRGASARMVQADRHRRRGAGAADGEGKERLTLSAGGVRRSCPDGLSKSYPADLRVPANVSDEPLKGLCSCFSRRRVLVEPFIGSEVLSMSSGVLSTGVLLHGVLCAGGPKRSLGCCRDCFLGRRSG